MESTKSPPSVIAKLMRLDYQPPQLPDLKRRRVLSENYLKKSDMIGLHERSVLNPGISSSTAISKRKESQNGVHQEIPEFYLARFSSIMDRNTDLSKTKIVCSKTERFSTEHPLIKEKLQLDELVNLPQDINCKEVLGYIQHSELHPKNSLQVHERRGHSGYRRAEKSLGNVRDRKCKTYSNTSEANIQGDYLRSLHTFNKHSSASCFRKFDIYSSRKLLKSRTYSKVNILVPPKISVLRPSHGMTSDSAECTPFTSIFTHAQSENVGEKKNGKIYGKMGIVSLIPVLSERVDQSIASKKLLPKRGSTVRLSSYKGTSEAKVGCSTHSSINGSSLSRLDGKKIFDKWRKNKISETNKLGEIICNVGELYRPTGNEIENFKSCNQSSQQGQKLQSGNSSCTGSTVLKGASSNFEKFEHEEPDLFFSHNLGNECIHGRVICGLSSACNLNSDYLKSDSDMKLLFKDGQVIHHEKECSSDKDDMLEDSSPIESIPPCISETMLADHQHNDVRVLPSEFKELLPDPLMKHNSPSKVWRSSSIKTSPYYLDEQRLDAAFSRKARVINSKSPTSVLEPCSPNTPTSDIFESENDDYNVHVQWLNSKSEETCSEGSGLVVSSDEESEEVSFHSSQDTERTLGRYGTEENKKLFYMLDILEKAELICINSEHYLRAWNSSESLVDPSVFELLELKYGKQTSWEKLERRLLFDRVNVGLKEILNIHIGLCTFETSLRRRRFTAALRRNDVKEELWTFLTNEEKDACKDLSDKEPYKEQKWLQVSEDVQTICKDIENVLFAELVGEIVNFPSL